MKLLKIKLLIKYLKIITEKKKFKIIFQRLLNYLRFLKIGTKEF